MRQLAEISGAKTVELASPASKQREFEIRRRHNTTKRILRMTKKDKTESIARGGRHAQNMPLAEGRRVLKTRRQQRLNS